MKKIVLTITSIFMIIIRFLIANDMGQSALRHDDTCATELKSEGKQVAYIVCNEKVISVIGYRENE